MGLRDTLRQRGITPFEILSAMGFLIQSCPRHLPGHNDPRRGRPHHSGSRDDEHAGCTHCGVGCLEGE
ncbi:hypothetical protein BJX66DRAFT_307025 [Aspergillus keveii]|uniref:Uncharacterized protein n=1 Tax=Aspergillus keveii TaxID=714993 RepID=A0ABR4G1J2_9EURO